MLLTVALAIWEFGKMPLVDLHAAPPMSLAICNTTRRCLGVTRFAGLPACTANPMCRTHIWLSLGICGQHAPLANTECKINALIVPLVSIVVGVVLARSAISSVAHRKHARRAGGTVWRQIVCVALVILTTERRVCPAFQVGIRRSCPTTSHAK